MVCFQENIQKRSLDRKWRSLIRISLQTSQQGRNSLSYKSIKTELNLICLRLWLEMTMRNLKLESSKTLLNIWTSYSRKFKRMKRKLSLMTLLRCLISSSKHGYSARIVKVLGIHKLSQTRSHLLFQVLIN